MAGPVAAASAAVLALCVYWVNVALLLATSGTSASRAVDASKYQVRERRFAPPEGVMGLAVTPVLRPGLSRDAA